NVIILKHYLTGYSGGTVIIYCHYYIGERSNEKYFCMGQNSWSCTDQIKTGLKNTWQHSGRFSLYDNTGGNSFKVIIRQLTRQDEETYWCGVDKPNIPDNDCCENHRDDLGGEATISCNYPENYENSIKYFCKESNDFKTCVYMIAAYQTTAKAGRFSVSENSREKSSTVTISDLTEDDTGTYWCGVETSRTEQRYITLITQVKLLVISEYKLPIVISPSSYISVYQPPLLPTLYTCSNYVTYCLTIGHGDGDYGEIKDCPLQSDSDVATSTIYATINIPTSYSDSLHYTSVNFHKIPSGPSEATTAIAKEGTSSCDYATVNCQSPIYSNANHPHCSSEAPPIYSTGSIPIDT
uniref:Ig-like domain-containing protein n=1 Tax=Hucho hucho TaxID=62062 RepID=A0A4W5PX29_9TELE